MGQQHMSLGERAGADLAGPTPEITQVLKLAGGGLGHYEALRLATYLQPNTTYTVTWQVKTDPATGRRSARQFR